MQNVLKPPKINPTITNITVTSFTFYTRWYEDHAFNQAMTFLHGFQSWPRHFYRNSNTDIYECCTRAIHFKSQGKWKDSSSTSLSQYQGLGLCHLPQLNLYGSNRPEFYTNLDLEFWVKMLPTSSNNCKLLAKKCSKPALIILMINLCHAWIYRNIITCIIPQSRLTYQPSRSKGKAQCSGDILRRIVSLHLLLLPKELPAAEQRNEGSQLEALHTECQWTYPQCIQRESDKWRQEQILISERLQVELASEFVHYTPSRNKWKWLQCSA